MSSGPCRRWVACRFGGEGSPLDRVSLRHLWDVQKVARNRSLELDGSGLEVALREVPA